jgi:CheY-like chemotaxis protein
MVAIAEAAAVAGAPHLESASADQMTRAWGLVRRTADLSLDELKERVAGQANVEVADLERADRSAAVLVPADIAHRRNVLPLSCTDRDVFVATANPFNQEAKREIASLTGRSVTFELAAPDELQDAVRRAYGEPREATDRPDRRSETPQPGGPHVLVVDDEAGQRALFRSVLEEAGFRVTVAKDGSEALDVLRGGASFDLVTLDYWMDKMNGLRVLQQMRADAELRRLPVVMVTGAGDRRIEMSLFEAGADDFVAKPVDAPLFLLRIQAVLRRRRHG